MAAESTGTTDRDRTLALLWRHTLGEPQGARGPRQKVTVDKVVATAIELADDEGLDALSMRRIAEKIGIGAMSLYTYVPGKGELIELMVDSVMGSIPRTATGGTSMRDRLDALAREEWEFYLRHPWFLQVDLSRPPLGPGTSDRYEYQVTLLDAFGLGDLDLDSILTLITGYTAGAARTANDAKAMNRASGQTDEQWWEANLPVLNVVMDDARYPVSGRVGRAVGEHYNAMGDANAAFEFGLRRILDGIDQYVASL